MNDRMRQLEAERLALQTVEEAVETDLERFLLDPELGSETMDPLDVTEIKVVPREACKTPRPWWALGVWVFLRMKCRWLRGEDLNL
jgi:hypothetical protein